MRKVICLIAVLLMCLTLVLPAAATMIYGLTIFLDGKEHAYRTAASFGLMCIYFAWSTQRDREAEQHQWMPLIYLTRARTI